MQENKQASKKARKQAKKKETTHRRIQANK